VLLAGAVAAGWLTVGALVVTDVLDAPHPAASSATTLSAMIADFLMCFAVRVFTIPPALVLGRMTGPDGAHLIEQGPTR
jgi:hypothetical protein